MCSGSVGTAPGLTREESIASLVEAQARLQKQINVIQSDLNQSDRIFAELKERLGSQRNWKTIQQAKLAKLQGEKAAVERQLKEVL